MLLADLGADVIRVDRIGPPGPGSDVAARGRRSISVDLKSPAGRDVVMDLVEWADILIEGYRPGVMERLGLGPEPCLASNPRLVFGRMTGWGQQGPRSQDAGHDIDYIAITGLLNAIGPVDGPPSIPLMVAGDLAGGALFLVVGVLSALLEVGRSGRGQVVDAAVVDGAVALGGFVRELIRGGAWGAPRGRNLLDGGAPFYQVYSCADGKYIAVGALEPQFYQELVSRSGVEVTRELDASGRWDPRNWPAGKDQWAALFATRSRSHWLELLDRSEACVAPVLDWDEAVVEEHLVARRAHVEMDGSLHAAPAPRFSRTPSMIGRPAPKSGEHTDEVLRLIGRGEPGIEALRAAGVVG
jgi:alpha-methylacyl-CoA racemase